jgi:hypothetical protein|tara:strand:+ start:1236 stop:1493 length:258 start_codon:yes stop_codon:yes gene_type:complete
MNRVQFLNEAINIVESRMYGDPKDCLQAIADLWSAYTGKEFTIEDVGVMMMLLKIARIKFNSSEDSWLDIAGYSAITYEASNPSR